MAPAYDLNPTPEQSQHELAVGIADKAPDLDVAIGETAQFCRLQSGAAGGIVDDVRSAVSAWRSAARQAGLSPAEVEAMSPAFMD